MTSSRSVFFLLGTRVGLRPLMLSSISSFHAASVFCWHCQSPASSPLPVFAEVATLEELQPAGGVADWVPLCLIALSITPRDKKNISQTTGGQEHRYWAICISIKWLSGCLEMAEKLFHSDKVDVITGSFLSALSTDAGEHTSCKRPPPDPVSCSWR